MFFKGYSNSVVVVRNYICSRIILFTLTEIWRKELIGVENSNGNG